MRESLFLDWVADRLVYVYGESENVDSVLRLREIADGARVSECLMRPACQCHEHGVPNEFCPHKKEKS